MIRAGEVTTNYLAACNAFFSVFFLFFSFKSVKRKILIVLYREVYPALSLVVIYKVLKGKLSKRKLVYLCMHV